jgi:hypothetical protein
MKLRSVLQAIVICIAMLVLSSASFAQTQCTSVTISGVSSQLFPNSGGSGNFFLNTSPSGCSPTFSTQFSPWISVTGYNASSGIGSFLVQINPGNTRSGSIMIGFATTSTISYTINQLAAAPPPEPAPPVVDMFRYNNSSFKHHFYTTNFNEQGYGGSGGWAYEGIVFHVLGSQQSGTVPLYRYYASSTHDHFYTTDFSELGNGGSGYVLEETQCYVYPTQQSGTIPLYRYRNLLNGEHFYTTDINEVGGNPGFVLEKIQAYVLP